MKGKPMKKVIMSYMRNEVSHVHSATELAENAAYDLGHEEWLDDETHQVWDCAYKVYSADKRHQ